MEHGAQDMDVVLQWLQLAEPLIRNGALGIDAFWRTLIGEQGGHIYPAPEQYGTHFESYLAHANARKAGYHSVIKSGPRRIPRGKPFAVSSGVGICGTA